MPDMQCTEPFPSRKVLKPVVEKQRRDRINRSLEEMRILLLKLTGNQKLRNPKMEKAEILEIAVIYIGNVTRTRTHDPQRWVSPAEKFYLSGFRDCLDRTEDFMNDVNPVAKSRFLDSLQNHLQHRLRFPKQLNLCGQEDNLSSSGNEHSTSMDSSTFRDDLSLCSPSNLMSSDNVSPPGWRASTPQNQLGYQVEQDHVPSIVWRPWP